MLTSILTQTGKYRVAQAAVDNEKDGVVMGSLIMGIIGLGLFGWSGTFRPEHERPEVFQGSVGTIISWVVMLLGVYLVYRGWVSPWF